MILGHALASVCWWSCYHSSQLIVSIKSAPTNWTIGSISHCCVSIHSFTIQDAKFVVYITGGISYLFSFSNSHRAFPLDNRNDSHIGIGIIPDMDTINAVLPLMETINAVINVEYQYSIH
jgi:hypothetical protein